jgi:hypothetical protein
LRQFWFYIVFSFGGILTSCIKEVPVDVGDEKPDAYFLNAFLCADSQARVQVGKVSGITESYNYVTDATVSLISNGKRFPLAYDKDGWYVSPSIVLDANESVRVDVVHGTRGLSQELRAPSRLQIQTIQTFPLVVGFVGRTVGFRLFFKDSAYNDNYYRLWVQESYWLYKKDTKGNKIDSLLQSRKLPISGDDIAYLRNPYNVYTNRELLFSDVTFNGLRTGLEFYRASAQPEDERTESYRVVLENLHPDLYHYYNDRNAHLWQQSSITQTPTKVEGNIEGVYGIFGLYQVDDYVVKF